MAIEGELITKDDARLKPLVNLTHLIYALHTLSVLIGVAGAPTVVGSFVLGIPSIAAVVLNYVKRSDTAGTFLESHFRWQIRTFWFAALWGLVAIALVFTLIGLPVAIVVFGLLTLWVIYRVARGWLRLNDRKAMYV